MRAVLSVLVIVMLGVGGAVAIVLSAGDDEGGGSPTTVGDPGGENAVLVTGTAERMALDPTLLAAVPFPITLHATEAGAATATISPVIVSGREESLAWAGGTPLELRALAGEPQDMSLDPVPVVLDATGVHVELGGAGGALTPGPYEVRGPVAVGATGLARPVDTLVFEATDETAVTFDGAVMLDLGPRPMTLEGPGTVVIEGALEVVRGDVERRLAGLASDRAPYRFDVVWEDGTTRVDGRIEGDIRDTRPTAATSTPSTSEPGALRGAPPRTRATPPRS